MNRLLALALALVPAIAAAEPAAGAPDADLQRLRREIAAAKLDRLLDLTHEQAQKLLPVLKEGQALVEQERAEHQKRKPQVVAALTQIRDDIRRNGVASEASLAALRQARGDAEMKETHQKMRALREQAKSISTQDQLTRLALFDPSPSGGDLEGEEGGGPDAGPAAAPGPGRHRGEHRGNRAAMMTVLSPEFVSLVEARAR